MTRETIECRNLEGRRRRADVRSLFLAMILSAGIAGLFAGMSGLNDSWRNPDRVVQARRASCDCTRGAGTCVRVASTEFVLRRWSLLW